jgi:hypothetical protein
MSASIRASRALGVQAQGLGCRDTIYSFALLLTCILFLFPVQAELSSIRASLALGADHQGLGWQEDMNSHLVPAVPPRTVKVCY